MFFLEIMKELLNDKVPSHFHETAFVTNSHKGKKLLFSGWPVIVTGAYL